MEVRGEEARQKIITKYGDVQGLCERLITSPIDGNSTVRVANFFQFTAYLQSVGHDS